MLMETQATTHLFGRMTDPTCAARSVSNCGDDIEFFLVINRDTITDLCYFSESGCPDTKIAAGAVAQQALGKKVPEALNITPATILAKQNASWSDEGTHSIVLATSTLYKALADYLHIQ